jgi:GMP synthase (glutamine-hydrolysing)
MANQNKSNQLKSHIMVIDPGTRIAETDAYNRIARVSPIPTTYYLPALCGVSSIDLVDVEEVSGVIVFGSGVSVNDPLDWQDYLTTFLTKIIEAKVPLLGICYGHQLLAKMYGAEIGNVKEDGEKVSGYREVAIRGGRIWADQKGLLVVSHRESVKSLPLGFHVLGSTTVDPFDVLEHEEKPIWSLQSHPEATEEFLINQNISPAIDSEPFFFGQKLVDRFIDVCANL